MKFTKCATFVLQIFTMGKNIFVKLGAATAYLIAALALYFALGLIEWKLNFYEWNIITRLLYAYGLSVMTKAKINVLPVQR